MNLTVFLSVAAACVVPVLSLSTAAPAGAQAEQLPVETVLAVAGSVGCQDNGCNGKLPEVQGCDADATTIWSYTYHSITTEMRYSPACRAVWGRIKDYRVVSECDSAPSVRVQSRVYEVASGDWRITATEARHMTGETRCEGSWVWSRMIGRANSEERVQYGRWTGETNLWFGGSGWGWSN